MYYKWFLVGISLEPAALLIQTVYEVSAMNEVEEIQLLSAEMLNVCVAKHKNSYLFFHEKSMFRVQH